MPDRPYARWHMPWRICQWDMPCRPYGIYHIWVIHQCDMSWRPKDILLLAELAFLAFLALLLQWSGMKTTYCKIWDILSWIYLIPIEEGKENYISENYLLLGRTCFSASVEWNEHDLLQDMGHLILNISDTNRGCNENYISENYCCWGEWERLSKLHFLSRVFQSKLQTQERIFGQSAQWSESEKVKVQSAQYSTPGDVQWPLHFPQSTTSI